MYIYIYIYIHSICVCVYIYIYYIYIYVYQSLSLFLSLSLSLYIYIYIYRCYSYCHPFERRPKNPSGAPRIPQRSFPPATVIQHSRTDSTSKATRPGDAISSNTRRNGSTYFSADASQSARHRRERSIRPRFSAAFAENSNPDGASRRAFSPQVCTWSVFCQTLLVFVCTMAHGELWEASTSPPLSPPCVSLISSSFPAFSPRPLLRTPPTEERARFSNRLFFLSGGIDPHGTACPHIFWHGALGDPPSGSRA